MIWLLACVGAVEQGERAWAAGDWAAVVEAWSDERLDAERTQRLARAYLRLDRGAEAAQTMAEVPAAERTAQGWLVLGTLDAERGEPRAAVTSFEAGLAREPLPELAVNLCLVALQLPVAEGAAAARCARATQLAPQDALAHIGLAEALWVGGQREKAGKEALSAAALVTEEPGLKPRVLELLSAAGEYATACSLGGGDPFTLGQACVAAGRPTEASRALEPLASERPEAAALLLRLAVDEAERAAPGGPRELALARAERWAGQLGEERWAGLLVDLGRLAALSGDWEAAEARWSEALALAPEEPAPRLNLARAYARRGADPRPMLQQAAGLDSPSGLLLSMALADEELRMRQIAEGEARLEAVSAACRAQALEACVSEAQLRLGLSRLSRGDEVGAIAALSEALERGGEGVRTRLAAEALPEAVRRELPVLSMDPSAAAGR